MANWIPVTVVPTSLATVAMATFMTEVSRVMRNWAAANVNRTICPPEERLDAAPPASVTLHCGSHRVGMRGFEPRTSCSQSRRAAKLRYIPFRSLNEALRMLAA